MRPRLSFHPPWVVVGIYEADLAKFQPDRALTLYTHAKKDQERADCSDTTDPDLCSNTTEYTNNHRNKYAVGITLHFINQ